VKALEETMAIMCDKEQLVSYLYDDIGGPARAAFDAHLRTCAACREELDALRGVRADLISWSPQQPEFGFRVVREPNVVQHPSWRIASRAWWTPAAGLAAAAVLVLAAAAGLAHVEIHRGPDGFTLRTGWPAAAQAAQPAEASADGSAATHAQARGAERPVSTIDPAALAAFERRIDALEALQTSNREAGGVRAASLSARASDADILNKVRELLAQSETKQQGELALRIAQVIRDVDAQRVADLSRIQQGFRGIEASVTAEAAGHRELTNYILASSKQK
jgi:Putative zinc-finger